MQKLIEVLRKHRSGLTAVAVVMGFIFSGAAIIGGLAKNKTLTMESRLISKM